MLFPATASGPARPGRLRPPGLLLLALIALLPGPARAQVVVTETFADGDFTQNPAWTGPAEHWAIDVLDGDPALRSNGLAQSDTLTLATASAASYGTWQVTLRYEGGALSNFNQIRVYLLADGTDLTRPVDGYFVQLGTNSRDVRLYRSDAARADPRVLLAQTDADLLPEDARTLRLKITRTEPGTWSIALDDAEVLTYEEPTPVVTSSSAFGFWVKHSAARGQSYWFDDVQIDGRSGPVDTTPPTVTEATYVAAIPSFELTFSELIDMRSVSTSDVFISNGVGEPFNVVPGSGRNETLRLSVQLPMNTVLPTADYDLSLSGIADLAGNVIRDTTVTVSVVTIIDEEPPVLLGAEARDAETVAVAFSEYVNRDTACDPAAYLISNGIGQPTEITPCAVLTSIRATEPDTLFLTLGTPLTTGTYTLTVRDIADEAGNVLDEAQTTFSYLGETVDLPAPGEIVVNEIFYDPPDSDLEFIELYNHSDKTVDLSQLTFADERGQAVAVAATVTALDPDGYAVLVRDAETFAAVFPAVPFIAPPTWPALNNGGDAVVVYAEDTVIDSVAYRPGWGGDEVSLERKDPGGPSNTAINWGSSTDPAGATPGRRNAIYEIDTTPPELRAVTANATADTLRVRFSEPLDPASVAPEAFRILGGAAPQVLASAVAADSLVLLALAPPLATGTYTLEVTNVADARGNVLVEASRTFDVFRPDVPAPGDIVINEIFYAPPDADLEFVELFNRSGKTFDLRQFSLADARLEPVAVTDAVTRLAPGGYAVLVRNPAVFAETFPDVATIAVASWPALNDGGDAAALLFGATVIDFVEYTPDWGQPGISLERRDPAGPSNAAVNFGPSEADAGATPGAQNSLFARDLSPPQPLFAEQTAPTQVRVTFAEPLDRATVTPEAFSLEGQVPASLVVPAPAQVDLRFDAPISSVRLTVAGLRDLFGNTLTSASLDVARLPEPGDVLLNEILFDPLADAFDDRPDQPEYVEVVNAAPYPVSLSRSFRTRQADETGDADTLRWAEGTVQVAPGGYTVFFAQPEPTPDPAASSLLAEAFSGIDFRQPTITLVPVTRSSLTLRNSSDLIRLHRADGTVLDAVPYDAAWHHPSLVDATGTALERITLDGASEDARNWSSSTAPDGGTPGRPNTLFLDPAAPPEAPGLTIEPSPFSPDGDGVEDVAALQYTLTAAPALIRARIFDAQGRLVRTLEDAAFSAQRGQLLWDGRDDAGRTLRIGIYIVLLEAVDERGGTTDVFKRPVVLARPLD